MESYLWFEEDRRVRAVAVQHMTEHPETLVSARDLSEHYELPSGLLAKIMQRLAAAGILESEQGVHAAAIGSCATRGD